MTSETTHEAFHVLANSVRRVYNRFRQATDQLHAETGVTAPKRTLLMDLRRYGAQPVPALAAARSISRQIIQTQVNELKKEGYVAAKPNPEHKRSKLIHLTSQGEFFVDEMIDREQAFMREIGWLPDPDELQTCIAVLDTIYEKLET